MLVIKDMASTAAIQIHGVSATYDHSFIHSPLMEWRWRVNLVTRIVERFTGDNVFCPKPIPS
jgi:hypothetical protein